MQCWYCSEVVFILRGGGGGKLWLNCNLNGIFYRIAQFAWITLLMLCSGLRSVAYHLQMLRCVYPLSDVFSEGVFFAEGGKQCLDMRLGLTKMVDDVNH